MKEVTIVRDLYLYEVLKDALMYEESENLRNIYNILSCMIEDIKKGTIDDKFERFIYDNETYTVKCKSKYKGDCYLLITHKAFPYLDTTIISGIHLSLCNNLNDTNNIYGDWRLSNDIGINDIIRGEGLNIRIDTYTGKPITKGYTNDTEEFFFEYKYCLEEYLSSNYGDDFEERDNKFYYDDDDCIAYYTEFEMFKSED